MAQKLVPNIQQMWQPEQMQYSVSGNSGSCAVKAYAYSFTQQGEYALACLYAEGIPESVDALIATMKDKNANKLQVGWGSKYDVTWAKGKWRAVKTHFKELRRAAVAIYPPTMLEYTPEKYSNCFLMQDGEQVTPWFMNLFGRRLKSIVNITVQDHWLPALLVSGEEHRLMNGITSHGCRAWSLVPETDRWQELITTMLRSGTIKLQNDSAAE